MSSFKLQRLLQASFLSSVLLVLGPNSGTVEAQTPSVELTVVESNVAGAPAGTTCRLGLMDLSDHPVNCRIVVSCGSVTLYGDGSSGYNICTVDEAQGTVQVSDASWTDGDPALTLTAQRSAGVTVRIWTRQWAVRLGPASQAPMQAPPATTAVSPPTAQPSGSRVAPSMATGGPIESAPFSDGSLNETDVGRVFDSEFAVIPRARAFGPEDVRTTPRTSTFHNFTQVSESTSLRVNARAFGFGANLSSSTDTEMLLWRARQTVRAVSMGPDAVIDPAALPPNGCFVLSSVVVGHSFDVAFVGSSSAISAGLQAPAVLFDSLGADVGRTSSGLQFRAVSRGLTPRNRRSLFVDSAVAFAEQYELGTTPEIIEYVFTPIAGRDCERPVYDVYLTRVEYSRAVSWDNVAGGPEIRVQSFVARSGQAPDPTTRFAEITGARDTHTLSRPMPQGVLFAQRIDPTQQTLSIRFYEDDAMGNDVVATYTVDVAGLPLPAEVGAEVAVPLDVRRGDTVTIAYELTIRRVSLRP